MVDKVNRSRLGSDFQWERKDFAREPTIIILILPYLFVTNRYSTIGMVGCPKNFSSAVAIDAIKREDNEALRMKSELDGALAAIGYE